MMRARGHMRGLKLLPAITAALLQFAATDAAATSKFGEETIALNLRWAEAAFSAAPVAVSNQLLLIHEDSAGDTKVNLSASGLPLRLANKTCSRGIGSNSRSELRISLSRPADRFLANIGLDRNVDDSTPASVEFKVAVGGTTVFASGVMRPKDGVRSIEVPLGGFREFEVIIDDGGDGRHYDQANWCEARVILQDGSTVWLDDLAGFGAPIPALPFSFVYGGKTSDELLPKWICESREERLDAARVVRILAFRDPDSGLVVEAVTTIYGDTPGVDWVLRFRNTGSNATSVIENVRAVDVSISPPIGEEVTLHRLHGSAARAASWQPIDETLLRGDRIAFGGDGGRPAKTASPFFTLDWGGGGVITAVGWSGQWTGSVARLANGQVRVQAGMQFLRLRLEPGETIRTPRILQLYWNGGDRDEAHNQFRRTMLAHIVPQLDGRPVFPPVAHLSTSFYELNRTDETNTLSHLASIRGLGFETFWLDAYWIKGGFPAGVGNYGFPLERVHAPDRFPNGLAPIAQAVRESGLKFLLWFEPERVSPGTALASEHPEWINHHLFDLGIPEARDYMTRYLKAAIRQYGVDVLRIDFNIDPLAAWEASNSRHPERVGLAEIRSVEGLYRLWDELRAEFPRLVIDNCASGGTRIDLETIARSVALWRTDDTIDPLFRRDFDQAALQNQVMTAGLNRYLPFSLSGQMGAEPYHFRSGFNGGIAFAEDCRPVNFPRQLLRDAIAEGKRLRRYYASDFYALSQVNADAREWCVMQYHRPEDECGIIVAFRRHRSPFAAYECEPRGIDEAGAYEVTRSVSYQPEPPVRMKGGELRRLKLEISERPGSVIVEYRRIKQ
jgi:alpha-galactosidase